MNNFQCDEVANEVLEKAENFKIYPCNDVNDTCMSFYQWMEGQMDGGRDEWTNGRRKGGWRNSWTDRHQNRGIER